MDTKLSDVYGVGGATIATFHRAGLHKVGDVYPPNGGPNGGTPEEAVRRAVRAMATEQGQDGESAVWRALATRCATVIRRLRSADATPYCPEPLVCPITHTLMEDPCVTKYGDTFERVAIERYVDERGQDPLSRRPLALTDLIPNKALKDMIDVYNAHFMRFAVPYRVRP